MNQAGKPIIPAWFVNETGEIPKVFKELLFKNETTESPSVADQLWKELSGSFKQKKDGSLVLPKSKNPEGTILDKDGRTCSQEGYLMDQNGNIVD